MAIVQTMTTYDLNGKKLSFANWISNLSPTETPFVSMTGKEAITQTLFQWQTDRLPAVNTNNAQVEGSKATDDATLKTVIKSNNTQILRQVVQVADTANTVAAYGRGKELQYQMEKAGNEIKRDLELAFLTQIAAVPGSSSSATRKTAGFVGLVGDGSDPSKKLTDSDVPKDPDTQASISFKTNTANLLESDIFDMTYNLYIANSKANVIMYHPKHANTFSQLQEDTANSRIRMFENMDTKINLEVNTIIDPLGQKFALVPNRFMPEDKIFFFNPADWTQMVFRAPQRTKLAKEGSYEKWMIEMEVGLRHRNPYASGVLKIGA